MQGDQRARLRIADHRMRGRLKEGLRVILLASGLRREANERQDSH